MMPTSPQAYSISFRHTHANKPGNRPVPALRVGHEVRWPRAQVEEGLKSRYTNPQVLQSIRHQQTNKNRDIELARRPQKTTSVFLSQFRFPTALGQRGDEESRCTQHTMIVSSRRAPYTRGAGKPRRREELDYRRHGHGARGRRPGRAPRRRHLDSWLLTNCDHRSVVQAQGIFSFLFLL